VGSENVYKRHGNLLNLAIMVTHQHDITE
jgi:hypothetical protein